LNVLLDTINAQLVRSRYTVLELDRFIFPDSDLTMSAYCIVERMPLEEINGNANRMTLHESLITDYRNRRWSDCLEKIAQLQGKWYGEMDDFYDELKNRITGFIANPPGDDWTYLITQ